MKTNEEMKVNGVNAVKAQAQAKANKLVLSDIFANFDKASEGLCKTSLGKKQDVYKKDVFAECTSESQIKATRRKIRNYTFSALSTIAANKSEKVIRAFIDFYKEVYIKQDFSFNSVANDNLSDYKKEPIKKGLAICKEFLEKNNK